MNEKGLIEQVLRMINKNYSDIYVIDINSDIVLTFNFTESNSLVISEKSTYTDFIEKAQSFVNPQDLSKYFNAISLNNLEVERQKGNSETKVKYRKLGLAGEYRWYVNIIDYLPFEGKRLIFMMSEDINDRLTDVEETTNKLEKEVDTYKNRLNNENESISDAIYQINNLLVNGNVNGNTANYINSVFNKIGVEHPELNQAIATKMATASNYRKSSILIIDDSSIIRNSLKRIFANDFEILMAKDGNEAIEILKNNLVNSDMMQVRENIVGILLDLVMPGSDGFQVLEYMQRNKLFNKVPVAIISGDETKETRKRVYQYDIVDMLEKPFNTEQIRRRIGKIINLYMSSNNLQNIVEVQDAELKNNVSNDDVKNIINQIVENVLTNRESTRLKKMVRLLAIGLANNSKYNLDAKLIDRIINYCPLYNIGAIAIKNDEVITSKTIQKEIDFGLTIIRNYIFDEAEFKTAGNIVKYSCEMYNGSGYPEGIKGELIPIEAQITNMAVRLNQYLKAKSLQTGIKNILTTENSKYNPDLLNALESTKKEFKDIN